MTAKAQTPKVSKPVRPLFEIAQEIRRDWTKPYFAAVPYLQAMGSLDKITDMFFQDSAKEIVLRFLSNAQTWKGEKAREIKAELNKMCK